MNKRTKHVIEQVAKDAENKKMVRWQVALSGASEGKTNVIEVIADGWRLDGEERYLVFFKGDYDDSNDVAIFYDWLYAIKKTSE